jgi:hypothetical protein
VEHFSKCKKNDCWPLNSTGSNCTGPLKHMLFLFVIIWKNSEKTRYECTKYMWIRVVYLIIYYHKIYTNLFLKVKIYQNLCTQYF